MATIVLHVQSNVRVVVFLPIKGLGYQVVDFLFSLCKILILYIVLLISAIFIHFHQLPLA